MPQEYHKQNAATSDDHYQPQMANWPSDSSAAAVIVAGSDPLLNVHQRMGIPLNLDFALKRSRRSSIWCPRYLHPKMKGHHNTELDANEQQGVCTSHHGMESLRVTAGLARLPDAPEAAHKDLGPLVT